MIVVPVDFVLTTSHKMYPNCKHNRRVYHVEIRCGAVEGIFSRLWLLYCQVYGERQLFKIRETQLPTNVLFLLIKYRMH